MSRLRLLLVLIVASTAVAAIAQTSFVIERIDVSPEARVRPGIIRAETRLTAGRSYTAEQLDQAMYRIRRLPFVVDAMYTLEPGNSPSSRVMKITVFDQEALNFNFALDVLGIHGSGGATSNESVGYRFLPGATGVLDLTAGGGTFLSSGGPPSGSFQGIKVAFTEYGLFGTSAYAAAGVGLSHGKVNPSCLIGVPLGLTQTFRGTYERSANNTDTSTFASGDWLSDRTDDPYFARRGLLVSAGPEWSRQRSIHDFNVGTRFFFHDDTTIDRKGVGAMAEQFRPLAQHSAIWGSAALSRFDESRLHNGAKLPGIHESNAELLVGLAHNFDSGAGGGDLSRRARIEGGVGYRLQDRQSSAPGFRMKDRGIEAKAGSAYRSRWGTFHFTASYVAD